MASLSTKVKKYLEANSKTWDAEQNNIVLQNDGSGDYIHTWNVSGLSKPSESDCTNGLKTLQDDFDTAKTNATNKKASGKQKLKDLGLDDAEIKVLMGA